jgi:hypothetical protein
VAQALVIEDEPARFDDPEQEEEEERDHERELHERLSAPLVVW